MESKKQTIKQQKQGHRFREQIGACWWVWVAGGKMGEEGQKVHKNK